MSNGSYIYQFLRDDSSPTGKSAIPPYAPMTQKEKFYKSLKEIREIKKQSPSRCRNDVLFNC